MNHLGAQHERRIVRCRVDDSRSAVTGCARCAIAAPGRRRTRQGDERQHGRAAISFRGTQLRVGARLLAAVQQNRSKPSVMASATSLAPRTCGTRRVDGVAGSAPQYRRLVVTGPAGDVTAGQLTARAAAVQTAPATLTDIRHSVFGPLRASPYGGICLISTLLRRHCRRHRHAEPGQQSEPADMAPAMQWWIFVQDRPAVAVEAFDDPAFPRASGRGTSVPARWPRLARLRRRAEKRHPSHVLGESNPGWSIPRS